MELVGDVFYLAYPSRNWVTISVCTETSWGNHHGDYPGHLPVLYLPGHLVLHKEWITYQKMNRWFCAISHFWEVIE